MRLVQGNRKIWKNGSVLAGMEIQLSVCPGGARPSHPSIKIVNIQQLSQPELTKQSYDLVKTPFAETSGFFAE